MIQLILCEKLSLLSMRALGLDGGEHMRPTVVMLERGFRRVDAFIAMGFADEDR